jgi:hypothetical protein
MNQRILELAEQAGFYVNDGKIYIPTTDEEITEFQSKFAELVIEEHARKLVQANMSNLDYARAMDEYYEKKWAHRFD